MLMRMRVKDKTALDWLNFPTFDERRFGATLGPPDAYPWPIMGHKKPAHEPVFCGPLSATDKRQADRGWRRIAAHRKLGN